jgi:hypothetical protein
MKRRAFAFKAGCTGWGGCGAAAVGKGEIFESVVDGDV